MKSNPVENKILNKGTFNQTSICNLPTTKQEYCDTYEECSEEEWEIFKMEAYLRRLRTKISDD